MECPLAPRNVSHLFIAKGPACVSCVRFSYILVWEVDGLQTNKQTSTLFWSTHNTKSWVFNPTSVNRRRHHPPPDTYVATQREKHDDITFSRYHAIVVAAQLTTSSRQPSLLATMTCCCGWMAHAVNPNPGLVPLHQIRSYRSPNCNYGPHRHEPVLSGDDKENMGGSGENAGRMGLVEHPIYPKEWLQYILTLWRA